MSTNDANNPLAGLTAAQIAAMTTHILANLPASATTAKAPTPVKPNVIKHAGFLGLLHDAVRADVHTLGKAKVRLLAGSAGFGLLSALQLWGADREVTPGMVSDHIMPTITMAVGNDDGIQERGTKFPFTDAKRCSIAIAAFHTAFRKGEHGFAVVALPNDADAAEIAAVKARNAAVMAFRELLATATTDGGPKARDALLRGFVAYVEAMGATNADAFRVKVCGLATQAAAKKPEASEDKAADGDKPEASEGAEPQPKADAKSDAAAPQGATEPKAPVAEASGTGQAALPVNGLLLAVRSTVDAIKAMADTTAQLEALRVLKATEEAVHEAVEELKALLAAKVQASKAAKAAEKPEAEPKASAKPKAGKPGGPASVSEKRDMATKSQTLLGQKMGEALALKQAAKAGNVTPTQVAADAAARKRGSKPGRGKSA